MILAHGPPLGFFVLLTGFFVICALVTWLACWRGSDLVRSRHPRLSRIVGVVVWTFLLVLGITSLVLWRGARGPMNQLFLALQAVLGMTSAAGAIIVCLACSLLNKTARAAGRTEFVPAPSLGKATMIGAAAAFASLGLLGFFTVISNRPASPGGWNGTWMLVGTASWVLLMSIVTATILPAKLSRAVATTILYAVLGVVAAAVVVALLSFLPWR